MLKITGLKEILKFAELLSMQTLVNVSGHATFHKALNVDKAHTPNTKKYAKNIANLQ